MKLGKITPLFGSGTRAKSPVVTVQRRLNCYMEQRRDGDKTKVAIYGTPGLVAAFQPTTPLSQPMRGMLGTQTALYLVAYNQFQSVNSSGGALFTATLPTSQAGLVGMAVNATLTQLIVADGAAGYLYTPGAATFVAIGASFPVTARTVTYVANFFVAEQPGTPFFWVSAANDGSTWNSLSFAAAAAFSDTIVAVDNIAGNLVTFSQQHTEFWQSTGASPVPFAPILAAANEYGLAAIYSRGHVNQTLIYLAQNREGQVQVVQLNGFSVSVISDSDIESLINSFTVKSDAVALVYGVDTHKFYQLSFPTANRSFLYDTASGLWSEVQTGPSVIPVRHTGNLATYTGGQVVVSDYLTKQIYTLSPTVYTDNGTTIIREVTTRHILSNFNRVRPALLYLDMETGVGLQSGQGSNPMIMLQYSKDNGRTWSAERWVSLGPVGQYLTRVIWRRFGSTRDATWKIRMSDPVKFVITEGSLKIKEKRAA